jgi:hypothetical protein
MMTLNYIIQNVKEMITHKLPLSHGKAISMEFHKLLGYRADYINYGFAPGLKKETIMTNCFSLDKLTSACEGYLNARLSPEAKKQLKVDTSKDGWLKSFQIHTHTNVGGKK